MLTSFPQITTYWCQNSFRGCWSYLRGGRRLLWSCIHTVTPRRIPQWRHPAKYTVHHTEFWCALCSSMSVTLLIQDLRLHMAFLLFTASHSLLCPVVKKKQKEAIGQWQGIQMRTATAQRSIRRNLSERRVYHNEFQHIYHNRKKTKHPALIWNETKSKQQREGGRRKDNKTPESSELCSGETWGNIWAYEVGVISLKRLWSTGPEGFSNWI